MLKFAGDRAVGLGASDKELAALPVLTNEQIRALTIRASAIHRSSRDEVNAAAKRITAGRNAAALGIPDPLDLATFVPPDTVWVVDGLIPQGGSLWLFAERKPGNDDHGGAVAGIADGDAFLGRFDTRLPADA
jgi:hypothetical protein